MNNDLISRSALIKWIDDSVSQYGNTYSTDMLNMWGLFKDYLINNAPTVEQKYYERIVAQINPVIEARPQGEWKEFKYGLYYCSRCFERVDKDIERIETLVSKGERSNYCPVCGAKMGGTT